MKKLEAVMLTIFPDAYTVTKSPYIGRPVPSAVNNIKAPEVPAELQEGRVGFLGRRF
jgi:hypothetical protein